MCNLLATGSRSGGQNAPPVVVFTSQVHSPPPPWYVHAPSPPAQPWAGVVGYTRLPSAVVSSPRGAWDRLTFDPASRRLYVSAGEDGLLALTVDASSAAPLAASATLVQGSNDCNGLVLVPASGSAPALGSAFAATWRSSRPTRATWAWA